MKKRLAILLSVCLIFTVSVTETHAANTKLSDMYASYYEFLEDRIADVGYIAPSTMDTTGSTHDICTFYPKQAGVFYAKLVDFDNNGADELFLIESVRDKEPAYSGANYYFYDLQWYVYSYANQNIVLLESNRIGRGYFGFTKDKNGATYYYEGNGQCNWDDFTFWSLKNGSFTASNVELTWTPDWSFSGTINGHHVSGHSDTSHGDGSGFITSNGKSTYISEKEIAKLRAKITAGGQELYDYDHRPADQAVQTLMHQIEANYFPNYHTPSAWAGDIVTQAINSNIVPKSLQRGYQRSITRREFCALAVQFYESTTKSTITQRMQFKDTSDVNVQKMGGLGIVTGVGNGNFNPNGLLTRESAAVILVRLAESLGIDFDAVTPNFSDNKDISSWAYSQVGKVQVVGVMGGMGNNTFSPKSTYTREQSIATVMRIMDVQPEIDSLELNETAIRLLVGASKTVSPVINAEHGANKTLQWNSSNPQIATVDQSGHITANSAGTATITAVATNGISASCTVTVFKPTGQVYSEYPVTLKCLELPFSLPSDANIHYTPENAKRGGTIQITDMVEKTNNYGITLVFNGKVKTIESDVEYFTPYFKWILEDVNGKTITSGIAHTSRYKNYKPYKPGDDFQINIDLFWGITGSENSGDRTFKNGQYYSIRFIED